MQYPGLPSQHKAKGTPEQAVPVGRAAMAQAEQSLLARRRSERAAFYWVLPENTPGTSLHSPGTSQSKAQRWGAIQQLLIFSVDIRCNTKHLRAWVWPPTVRKGADRLKWLPLAEQTECSFLKLSSCPDLCVFQVFPETQSFCPPHTVELIPLSMGIQTCLCSAIRKGLQILGRKKNPQEENWLCFSAKKSGGKKRKKSRQEVSFFLFLFLSCVQY